MKKRVLVIDDDAGVRLTVHHILVTAGYEVQSIGDSKLVLKAFRHFAPDVVITDLVMPGVGATDVIVALREQHSSTKIIAMSGGARLGRTNILQHAREAGADGILAKPFTVEQLKNVVVSVSNPSGTSTESRAAI